MSFYNVVAETNENTVVYEYIPKKNRSEHYQSEAELEKEFINMLCEQGYEYLSIKTENDLKNNLREKLEELNKYKFSNSEWNSFFKSVIANPNEHIVEKTQKIQEDNIQVLKCDDGSSKNITLIDKKNIHNNSVQVINQYVIGKKDGAKYNNRYDVTILVNGFPLVHVELKRRGVAIKEAFNQINRYQSDSFWAGCGLYEYIQIFVISNGTHTKYYSNTTRFNSVKNSKQSAYRNKNKTSNSFEFTSFWADAKNKTIADLIHFTETFFAKHTILNILTKYCVFTSENILLVMRPYQITATEAIINKIKMANSCKTYGSTAGGGYIWHTTGSGKTLTSFKTAREASNLNFIDKVLFVVDRKDLDYQTMKEYDRFEKGSANSNVTTKILARQLEDENSKIIITTIQKLSTFVKKNPDHKVYKKHVVIIFDECHRSQFGEMHTSITKKFSKYYLFGFTGTPVFSVNALKKSEACTTEYIFGDKLHAYTIVNAINDKNVLGFKVDYVRTMNMQHEDEIDDEMVNDIDREKLMMHPERIKGVTKYILNKFDLKTYRGHSKYSYFHDLFTNISEIVSKDHGVVEGIKEKQRIIGFNSIFAVASVNMAKLYYDEFKRQMGEDPKNKLRIATIFSFGANEEEYDGDLGDENPENASSLDKSSRDFLEEAIEDYNKMFHTNYDTSSEKFQNYYKDVSLRMKNKELDLLIVVNMFLTGFDATTLNTLWVDKNLKMHGLIQAFSRTNRIFNSVKSHGNIVCFRNLQKCVDDALVVFGDDDAKRVIILNSFKDYYYGYTDKDGKRIPGYLEMVEKLKENFPVSDPNIIGEKNQEEFVLLFGAILRMRNLLISFDEFAGKELITERDFQDYLGKYQDIRDEWNIKRDSGEKMDVGDDVVFEVEFIKEIEINIDYILMLVKKYHDTNCKDKEVIITINKAINASPELRSKRQLIESFIKTVDVTDNIFNEWDKYVISKYEEDVENIVKSENLNLEATKIFLKNAFRNGEIKTYGTDINSFMPSMSRLDKSSGMSRAEKKQSIIYKLKELFERYSGILGFKELARELDQTSEEIKEPVLVGTGQRND